MDAPDKAELNPDSPDYGTLPVGPESRRCPSPAAVVHEMLTEQVPLNVIEQQQQPGNQNDKVTVGPAARQSEQPSKLAKFNAWLLEIGPSWLSNENIQKNKKLIMFATGFCVFGFVLCLAGVCLVSSPPHALYNLVFVVGGFIVFVPGIYYLMYVIRAYRGDEGFDFQDLPQMD